MIHRKKIVLYLTAAAVCIGLCSCTPSLPETEETFDREGIVSEDGIYESSALGEDSALSESSALNESSTLSEDSIVSEDQAANEEELIPKQSWDVARRLATVTIPDGFADTVPQKAQDRCLSAVEINLETGERMIACALLDHYSSGDIGTYYYDVQIYRLGESEPFQTFQDASMMDPSYFFGLEDINGDGIQDLFTTIYLAQNSTYNYYVWSPSQGKYLKVPIENGISGTDPLTRRFYIHLHGSAIDGQNYTYQWVGETEIVCIRSLCTDLDISADNVEVDIYISDAATGEISINYEYDWEEYDERYPEIWDIYYCTDFFWYGEYESMGGHAYQIWYGQKRWLSDEDPNEILYEDKLYVYTPEGYLESLIEEETSAAAKEIVWDETTATLCITYEDGSIKSYQVDE